MHALFDMNARAPPPHQCTMRQNSSRRRSLAGSLRRSAALCSLSITIAATKVTNSDNGRCRSRRGGVIRRAAARGQGWKHAACAGAGSSNYNIVLELKINKEARLTFGGWSHPQVTVRNRRCSCLLSVRGASSLTSVPYPAGSTRADTFAEKRIKDCTREEFSHSQGKRNSGAWPACARAAVST